MKIISVVGARPNFMKIAPFIQAIQAFNDDNKDNKIQHLLVHTGQHYDDRMSRSFFEDLNIPQADINLGIGSGSHAEQVGQTMIAFEKVVQEENPDWVVVVGDVNATLACSVTAKKEHINCCHIEAGLRSGDIKMPEEINRLVTDRLSDLLLVPDMLSIKHLEKEGVEKEKIKFVGNIMIDTLESNKDKASAYSVLDVINQNLMDGQSSVKQQVIDTLFRDSLPFALMTMHRPSNVDNKTILKGILDFICDDVISKTPVIWPIHPRTVKQLKKFDLWEDLKKTPHLILLHPIGYHQMLRLNMSAKIMLTDSGGLQEECCVLGTPCLTLRENTERPITLREHGGASVLVGNNVSEIRREFHHTISLSRIPVRPPLWDGKTAQRCLDAIINHKELI